MGTNYYARKMENVCSHCGRGDTVEQLHVGKSSGGWCFALHVIPERGLNSLEDWKAYLQQNCIALYSDSDIMIEHHELIKIITERSWPNKQLPSSYRSWRDFHALNHSFDGPNDLVRYAIDRTHCVGHGDGTWDLMIGEFS